MTRLPDPSRPLDQDEAEEAFAAIFEMRVDADAIGHFLLTMTERGETATEIAVAAQAMRERMIRIAAPDGAIDVCGTGGDGQHSLNISTAVSMIVAAAGVPMAKHGNRAASSKAGAADTLEALGLDLHHASQHAERSLHELGIAFLFAPEYHPALKVIGPVRKKVGRRTIFNLLGPLANPAMVKRQLIGIASPTFAPIFAEACDMIGLEQAIIAAGDEGLDELSIAGSSRMFGVRIAVPSGIIPEDLDLEPHSLDALRGGNAEFNANALLRLLEGEAGAYRNAVVLNAAAALHVAGAADGLATAARLAEKTIDSGAARDMLARWVAWQ